MMNARRSACLSCASSDAMYDHGDHYYCYSCQSWFSKDGEEERKVKDKVSKDLIIPTHHYIERRGLTSETTSKYSYSGGEYWDKKAHIAQYRKEGVIVAQHIRIDVEKDFYWLGDTEELELFGQHLFQKGGQKLVITEGEIDAMSISQVQGNKYPCVSVPSGAQSAKKYIAQNLEWIESFNEVILAFDDDEAGRKAISEVSTLIDPKKLKVADYGNYKDYNEMLLAGETTAMISSVFNAEVWKPDGIISASELTYELLSAPISAGVPYPYDRLNSMLYGGRGQEITIWTAGSGLGKTSILRELQYHYLTHTDVKQGIIFLEESVQRSAQGLVAIDNNIPLHQLRFNGMSEELYQKSIDKMFKSDKLYFHDHFGSLDADNLLTKIRYMRSALDVDYIWLDHISIVVSGTDTNDERKTIDMFMTKLRSMVQETGVGIHAVVHLKRKDGKQYNQGGGVNLSDLRGSGALEQLSDNVIGLQRDQHAEDQKEANTTELVVLKCRETGKVGKADKLFYDHETGRMHVVDEEEDMEY